MSKRISQLICWICLTTIFVASTAILISPFKLYLFARFARSNLEVPILWNTVATWQWYGLWVLTVIVVFISLVGVYFLYKAFKGFASGELFNLESSINLRRFSIILLLQVVLKPLYISIAGILLSINHPAGQKVLIISLGSEQVSSLVLGLIIWVLGDMLVAGHSLQAENRQFV